MANMTDASENEMTLSDIAAPATRQDVEHLFGRCLLRFQAFELLMKSMLEGHFVSGSIARPEDALTRQIDDTRRKTMGLLVGDMMGSLLVPAGQEGSPDVIEEASGSSFAIRLQIALPFEVLARIETEHRALVALRNSLVHHFLEEHDLGSEAGRDVARQALAAALDRISHAYSDLHELALEINIARKAMAEKLATPDVRDWIASGQLPWPATIIVQALLNASTTLAPSDWTSVDAAAAWIASHYPNESPEGYGCRTWRQVIHSSGQFELQLRKADGRRHGWYRPRVLKQLPD